MTRVRKPFIPAAPTMCGGKRRYRSKREAEDVKAELEMLKTDLKLGVYRCTSGCGGWHLTRRTDDREDELNS
jgi:hypothetical protein